MIHFEVYYNMNNLKFKNIDIKNDFTWYFHDAIHKNYNYDSPFRPNYAFTQIVYMIMDY